MSRFNIKPIEDAKKCWCPFVRVGAHRGSELESSFNRYLEPGFPDSPVVCCIGPKCMAWRFVERYIEDGREMVPSDDTHGYCGLAGTP
jgi:hypothetical protein